MPCREQSVSGRAFSHQPLRPICKAENSLSIYGKPDLAVSCILFLFVHGENRSCDWVPCHRDAVFPHVLPQSRQIRCGICSLPRQFHHRCQAFDRGIVGHVFILVDVKKEASSSRIPIAEILLSRSAQRSFHKHRCAGKVNGVVCTQKQNFYTGSGGGSAGLGVHIQNGTSLA